MKKRNKKVIELAEGKPRKEEEKFFERFSERQLTAVLLFILAATFLVQGITKYLEIMNKTQFIRPWFFAVLLSMAFLTFSVVSISLGGIIFPLGTKRKISIVSFSAFIMGFVLFLASLIFLLFVI